jgi:resuscitation-promoting factor RpfA
MPGMEKSPDAFRTISEVADWLGVPTHVLRFWESRFTQVKPVKRAGGRRYYRPSDMELIGGIKRLLHDDGMTIRGVQKLLREKGVRHVASLSPPLYADIDDAELIEAETEATVVAFERPAVEQRLDTPEQPSEEQAEAAGPEVEAEVTAEEALELVPVVAPETTNDIEPAPETGIFLDTGEEVAAVEADDSRADSLSPVPADTPAPEADEEPHAETDAESETDAPAEEHAVKEPADEATAEGDLFDRLAPTAEAPELDQFGPPDAADLAGGTPPEIELEEDTGDDDLIEEPALSVASRLRIAAHDGLSPHAETLVRAQARLLALRDRMDGRE